MPLDPGIVTRRARPFVISIGLGVIVFLAMWPLLSLFRELVVVATAVLLRAVVSFPPLREALLSAPTDPLYTRAALEMVGKIRVAGVAVAAPVGDLLHSAFPGLFASPELAGGAWATAVIRRGSAVMARGLSLFAGDVALLVTGIVLVRLGLRGTTGILAALKAWAPRPWLLIPGLLVQAQVLVRLATNPPSPRDLEAAGVSFGFGVLFPWLTGRRLAVSDLQYLLPGPLLPLLLAVLALLAAYAVAVVLVSILTLLGTWAVGLGRQLPFLRLTYQINDWGRSTGSS